MGKYKVKKINPLGEHSVQYGQRYWGEVEEADMPVSFNLMNPKDIPAGAELEFEEKAIKETKKGQEYMFLRKVKVGGITPPTQTSISDRQKLDAIHGDVKLALSFLRQLMGEENATPEKKEAEEDKVVEFDPEEEINLEDIPFN